MRLSLEDLKTTMRGKTDEELYRLLHLHSQDYTLEAIGIADEEFRKRKLDGAAVSRIAAAVRGLTYQSQIRPGSSPPNRSALKRELDRPNAAKSSSAGAAFLGFLACLSALVLMLYFQWADDPWTPGIIDSTGWVSHTVESTITAQSNWMVGESKQCISYPLDGQTAKLADKKEGYAFLSVQCDSGPAHNIAITFRGAKNQAGKTVAIWNCTRTSDSFTCKQTGAY